MALTRDQLNQIYQKHLGRPLGDADVAALGGEGGAWKNMDKLTFTKDVILPSQEYFTKQESTARRRYAPELEQIGFEEEQARKQSEIAGKGLELEKKGISETKSQLEYDLEDAIKSVRKQQKEQEVGFLNQQQRLGLRPSGLTVGGLGELATETGTQISRLERTRANKLAQLALQENELTLRGEATQGTLASGLKQTQIRRGGVEQNISDTKQNLIDTAKFSLEKAIQENDATEFNRAIKLIELAQDTPEGQEIDLGKYGKISGTKPTKEEKVTERKTEQATVDGRRLLIYSDTGETVKDLGRAGKGTGDTTATDETLITKEKSIKAIENMVKSGTKLLDIGQQIYKSPLSEGDKKTVLKWFVETYKINLNSPIGARINELVYSKAKTGGIKRNSESE